MKSRFWIGTYKAKGGQGLVPATIDTDGRIALGEAEPRIVDASHGVWCDELQVAWLVCEQDEGRVGGWRLEQEAWEPLGSVETGGKAPCFVDISPTRQHLAVANYGSGSVALVELHRETGTPRHRTGFIQNSGTGKDPERQEGPHVHCARFSANGRSLLFADLGLDRVFSAKATEDGTLSDKATVFRAPPGFGPRHLWRLGTSGGFVVNGELAASLALLLPEGSACTLAAMAGTDPSNTPGNLGGHLLLDDDLVWISNRGANTIAAFRVQEGTLDLVMSFPSGGQSPRHFVRLGRHFVVAHEEDGTVTTIDIAAGTVASTVEVPGAAFVLAG